MSDGEWGLLGDFEGQARSQINRLVDAGLVTKEAGNVRLTNAGMMVGNEIGALLHQPDRSKK